MFNIHTLPGNFCNILHKADLPIRFCLDLHADISYFSAIMDHTVNSGTISSNRVMAAFIIGIQKFHKIFSCH